MKEESQNLWKGRRSSKWVEIIEIEIISSNQVSFDVKSY